MKVDQGPFSVSEEQVALYSSENSEIARVLKQMTQYSRKSAKSSSGIEKWDVGVIMESVEVCSFLSSA